VLYGTTVSFQATMARLKPMARAKSGIAIWTVLTPEARRAVSSLWRAIVPSDIKTAASVATGTSCVTISGILKNR
jgi:hypothetical protein